MAVRPKSQSAKASPAPYLIAVLLVALVLVVGWLAYANLAAPPRSIPMTAEAKGKNDRMHSLAQQSGGDISKLSEEDRNWVNQVTGGYGSMALRGLANDKK